MINLAPASAVVIGIDPSWSALAWCVATSTGGPETAGCAALAGRTWRWHDLLRILSADLAPRIRAAHDHGVLIRVVIERPPMVYGRGNQSATAYGMGLLSGAIQVWSMEQGCAYPWEVAPAEWRPAMGIGGKGRAALKAAAIRGCRYRGWSDLLDPYAEIGPDLAPRADVAEAILVAMYGVTHAHLAPRGPQRAAPVRAMMR